MSYRIEYQWGAFRVPAAKHGLTEDRFIVAIEGGDNNCYEHHSNERTRSWNVGMIGTANQVMKRAVYHAGSCEGGMLQPSNRPCSPEAYIRRIRRLINGPNYLTEGHWRPRFKLELDSPILPTIRELGIEIKEEESFIGTRAVAYFPDNRLADYFSVIDKHYDDIGGAWNAAEVLWLPKS